MSLGYKEPLELLRWPLPNWWCGTSVEDQTRADERIPLLLDTPAVVRWISAEPLLGPVELDLWLRRSPSAAFDAGRVTADMPAWTRIGATALDWVIVGGESGPGARPFDVHWARSIIGQCRAAGVPCFIKQIGPRPHDSNTVDGVPDVLWPRNRKGGDPAEWAADLRVREYPAQERA